jgi:serine/threonine-protein kinase RsbW
MHHHTAAPPPPATTAPPSCARCFPAVPRQVGEARRYLAGLLDGFPAADDALVCLSELASNAIQHTHSARPGGQFTVTVTRNGEHLRVEVRDDGGPWHPQPGPGGEHGRGLVIVAAMARWGVTGNGDGPRTVWFEITTRS